MPPNDPLEPVLIEHRATLERLVEGASWPEKRARIQKILLEELWPKAPTDNTPRPQSWELAPYWFKEGAAKVLQLAMSSLSKEQGE